MTSEVQILVTVYVDTDAKERQLSAKDKLSTVEGIRNALNHATDVGFDHSRSDKLRLRVVMVENVTGAKELGMAVDDAASLLHTQLATDIDEETKEIEPIASPPLVPPRANRQDLMDAIWKLVDPKSPGHSVSTQSILNQLTDRQLQAVIDNWH